MSFQRIEIKNLKLFIPFSLIFLFLGFIIFWAYNNNIFETSLLSVNIKNNQYFKTPNINIQIDYPGPFRPFSFFIDNKDVTSGVIYKNEKAYLKLNNLSNGKHVLSITSEVNIYSMSTHQKHINFIVDTIPPEINLETPKNFLLNQTKLPVSGKTKPNSKLTFNFNNKILNSISSPTGYFSEEFEGNPGSNKMIITAVDPAGNKGVNVFTFDIDNTPPIITPQKPVDKEIINTDYVNLEAIFEDTGAGIEETFFIIDNKKIDGNIINGVLVAELNNLDEGEYKVTAVGRDKAGGEARKEWSFIIETSEIFGEKTIRPGAVGEDIKELQKCLINLGVLEKNYLNGIYDEKTLKAVENYQKLRKAEVSPILNREMTEIFCNKIHIYLNECFLYLIAPDDKLIKRYPIACGSYAWPTPTGNFFIKTKELYPTWYPPPSPWAKGLKPIPPGPGNPLGTRWMGLSADGVGIHGTPSSWSIGYADSHGCIRMYISDAEELFDLINTGNHVDIYATAIETRHSKNTKNPDSPGRYNYIASPWVDKFINWKPSDYSKNDRHIGVTYNLNKIIRYSNSPWVNDFMKNIGR